MQLINKLIKKFIIKIIQYCRGRDGRIKKVEYLRGLYRYPNKMLGRKFPKSLKSKPTDVLVFAAHPDDDILGLGTTLYRHSLDNDTIKVIFVTNGTGRDGESWHIKVSESKWKSETRYIEAIRALSLIKIPQENIYCLGYPDGGTQRYIKYMYTDILKAIQKMNPSQIYVHCIEGGHDDHDLTSFIVKSVCNKIGYSNLFEWTQYNPIQPLGAHDVKFLQSQSNKFKEVKIDISKSERILKKKMLATHQSQDVEQFYMQGEAIRHVDISKTEIDFQEHCALAKRILPQIKKFNAT